MGSAPQFFPGCTRGLWMKRAQDFATGDAY